MDVLNNPTSEHRDLAAKSMKKESAIHIVILSYLKLLYFFLSITKTFIPKESSKTYRKSRIEV